MEASARKHDETRLERGVRLTLGSPVRRSIVRLLNGSANPVSTEDLAAELMIPVEQLGPQLHVLREYSLLELRIDRGSDETALSSLWASAVRNDPVLCRGLEELADTDAELMEARRQVSTRPSL